MHSPGPPGVATISAAVLIYYRHANGHTELREEFRAGLLTEPGLEDASAAEARLLTDVFHFHPLAVEDWGRTTS
jgi:hypothetical protein